MIHSKNRPSPSIRNRACWASIFITALVLGGTGCESPDIDAQNFRCESNAQCGPGWQCNTEPALSRCIRAYENVNGVFDDRIVLGMLADLGDQAIGELGKAGVAGYRAFFERINAAGGVHGRRIIGEVRSANYLDAKENEKQVKELIEGGDRQAFCLAGVLGTQPSLIAQQLADRNKVVFFAPATGADELEPSPPDPYVFNVRLRYSQEASQLARVLIRGALDEPAIPPENLGVFAQGSSTEPGTLDDFGQGGVTGVKRAVGGAGGNADDVEVSTYTLIPTSGGELDAKGVPEALGQMVKWMASSQRTAESPTGKRQIGIVLAALGDVAAPFTSNLGRMLDAVKVVAEPDQLPNTLPFPSLSQEELDRLKTVNLQLVSLSSVGRELLSRLIEGAQGGTPYGAGMIIASPMPSPSSNATGVKQYREDLKKYFPEQTPSAISLEGYINGRLLYEALDAHGRDITTESFVDTLESFSADLGIGTTLGFGTESHQATNVLWGVRLADDLTPVALERSITDLLAD
jgi:ABC-type branched-subunit amino acid transport system substrate-binding protein